MFRTIELSTILLSLVLFTACGEHGNGVFASERREVDSFSQLESVGAANSYISVEPSLSPGEAVTLTVSGDENLLQEVKTEVVAGTLIVSTEHDVWPDLELKVVMRVPELDDLESSGSGDVELTGARGTTFAVVHTGSGDVRSTADVDELLLIASGSGHTHLSGSATAVDFSASGSGDVRAHGLTTLRAVIRASGSGDVEICATERLDAHASGSGDIEYSCNPDRLTRDDTGSGSIRRK